MAKRKKEGETQLLLNIIKDLDINRFLDMCTHRNVDLFKKLVEGMKEGGCVRTVQKVRHSWKTLRKIKNKKLFCTAACKREYKWNILFH